MGDKSETLSVELPEKLQMIDGRVLLSGGIFTMFEY